MRMNESRRKPRGVLAAPATPFRVLWALATGGLLLLLWQIPVATATPSQKGVSWDYKLTSSFNQSQDPGTSLTIVLTGSGSFDTSAPSINGGGGYTILSGGSVVGSGTWTATQFDSFTPSPLGSSPGQGGHLELEASFTGTGVLVVGSHVVIQCSMWGPTVVGPPGFPWPGDFVQVATYTTPVSGGVMFHLNQA
jgi:hypothetical protein